jgi:hypothetical protein
MKRQIFPAKIAVKDASDLFRPLKGFGRRVNGDSGRLMGRKTARAR